MSTKQKNNYSLEFKISSAQLAVDSNQTVAQIARDLGINHNDTVANPLPKSPLKSITFPSYFLVINGGYSWYFLALLADLFFVN